MSWYRIGDKFACVPPKNGSTSFKMAVCGQTSTANLNHWAESYSCGPFETPGSPAYLSVRDPVDRFCSLWRCCQREHYHAESFVTRYALQGCNTEYLMSVIETCDNPHWWPQTAFTVPGAIPIHYAEFLAFLGLPVARENESVYLPCEPPVERIKSYYEGDFKLWSQTSQPLAGL